MENREKYCATQLRLIESEQFVAVGDARLGRLLNDRYAQDLAEGRMLSLPDLLSLRFEPTKGETFFRLREVKFKLEIRLVEKALQQLQSGLEWVSRRFDAPAIDRVELVVALNGRALKPTERPFLGAALGPERYQLVINGSAQTLNHREQSYRVSVLLL